jgi:hypothetical protein
MSNAPINGLDPEIQMAKKRQVWIVLLVMLASGCVGVLIVTGIIWLFRSVLPTG